MKVIFQNYNLSNATFCSNPLRISALIKVKAKTIPIKFLGTLLHAAVYVQCWHLQRSTEIEKLLSTRRTRQLSMAFEILNPSCPGGEAKFVQRQAQRVMFFE